MVDPAAAVPVVDHTVAIIAAVSTVCTSLITGVVAVLVARNSTVIKRVGEEASAASVAAVKKTEEVRATLESATIATDAKLGNLQQVAHDTHVLVNSNMGIQLRLNAVIAKRLADVTKDKDDVDAATLAQTAYQDHVKKQAVVDAGKS